MRIPQPRTAPLDIDFFFFFFMTSVCCLLLPRASGCVSGLCRPVFLRRCEVRLIGKDTKKGPSILANRVRLWPDTTASEGPSPCSMILPDRICNGRHMLTVGIWQPSVHSPGPCSLATTRLDRNSGQCALRLCRSLRCTLLPELATSVIVVWIGDALLARRIQERC